MSDRDDETSPTPRRDPDFDRLVADLRPELVVHCYRLLGRYDEAEDATQDALIRAWNGWAGFRDDAAARTWLYRIATHCCLDRHSRDRRRRDILARGTVTHSTVIPIVATVPWLQALPDTVIDAVDDRDPTAADRLTSRETLEIGYIAALQHLTPRQRAVLVLRDVAGWPTEQIAEHLDGTTGSVNALLRRARHAMRAALGTDRDSWERPRTNDPAIRGFLTRYIEAVESGNDAVLSELLDEEVVVSHQPMGGHPDPTVSWYSGRSTTLEAWAPALHADPPLNLRAIPVAVNRQPALAWYIRLPERSIHEPFGLEIFRLSGATVVEVSNFSADQFASLGLPLNHDADHTADSHPITEEPI